MGVEEASMKVEMRDELRFKKNLNCLEFSRNYTNLSFDETTFVDPHKVERND